MLSYQLPLVLASKYM